jgi:hypothetical protein
VRLLLAALILSAPLFAQTRVEYVGGTLGGIETGAAGSLDVTDSRYLAFYTKKSQIRVPYDRVNSLEYGQQVSHRLIMAFAISPIFLLAKKRKHFLSIEYTNPDGGHEAMVFRVDKNDIRAALVSLEARTGVKIEYQDQEARKAGHG